MKFAPIKPFTILFGALAMLSAAATVAQDDGAALFEAKACVTCHGVEGGAPTNDEIPKLTGQNKTYLINQLTDIRSGERDSGNAIQMKGIAQTLTDDDIVAIAEYLSAL